MIKIGNNSFVKNVLVLLSGTLISQIISGVGTFFLAKYFYDESDFGFFATYNSFLVVFTIIITGTLEKSIFLVKDKKEEIIKLFKVINNFIIYSVVIVLPFLLLGIFVYNEIFKSDKFFLGMYPLIFMAVLINAFCISITSFFLKNENYAIVSKRKVIQSSINIFLCIVLGYLGVKHYGLIFSSITAFLISFLFLYFLLRKKYHVKTLHSNIGLKEFKIRISKYRDFLKFQMPSSILNSLVNNALPALLVLFYSNKEIGAYFLGFRLISLPISILGRSVSEVYFKRASSLNAEGKSFNKIFIKTRNTLFLIFIIPTFIIYFFSKDLMVLILGEKWILAGTYMSILAPMYLFRFIASPLSLTAIITKKQYYVLKWQIALFLSVFLTLIVCDLFDKEFSFFLQILVLVYSFLYVLDIYFNSKFSKKITIHE